MPSAPSGATTSGTGVPIQGRWPVAVIVPTRNEAGNVAELVARLHRLLGEDQLEGRGLLMDLLMALKVVGSRSGPLVHVIDC